MLGSPREWPQRGARGDQARRDGLNAIRKICGGIWRPGHVFTFRGDGWFNMTKAAQAFGKELKEFWANKDTTEYILALPSVNGGNSPEYAAAKIRYVEASRGRHGGTWAHPKLAVFFARCWVPQRFPEAEGYRCDLREVGPQGFSLPWSGAPVLAEGEPQVIALGMAGIPAIMGAA